MPDESIQDVAFSAFIPGLKVYTRSENEATMTQYTDALIGRLTNITKRSIP
jgi:hypothetical protein